MSVKVNPFLPNDPAPPDIFVGRTRELNTITRAIQQTVRGRPESVLITGARGMGKTSAALFASNLSDQMHLTLGGEEEQVISVFVKCGGVDSLPGFCKAVLRELYKRCKTLKGRLLQTFLSFFKSANVKVGPFSLDLKPIEDDIVSAFPDILTGIWTADVQQEYGALQIIVDETDSLTELQAFPGFLKGVIETISQPPASNIQFVVTMVTDRLRVAVHNHSSFTRVFHSVPLYPLEKDEIELVVSKCLDQVAEDVGYSREFISFLPILSAGIPNFIHQICYDTFEIDMNNVLGAKDLFSALRGGRRRRGSFDVLWEKHFRERYESDIRSQYARKILHTVALFDEPALNREIDAKYRRVFGEQPSSNLAVYLTKLCKERVLVRHGSSPHTYEVREPELKVLLRYHPDTDPSIYKEVTDFMLREKFARSVQQSLNFGDEV